MSILDHFRKPRTNVVSSTLEFPSIDTHGMIKKLRLGELGKQRGERDQPGSDSESFDAVEQTIINEIETEGKSQYNSYLEHQKTYADRASDSSVQVLLLKLESVVGDAATDFERNTHVGTGILYARRREVCETERDLNRFRKEHGLSRPARDFNNQKLKVGVLIIILAVESVLNGFFLSKGSDFGLLGGIFQALIIAFINVFLGASVGRFVLPWLCHRNWFSRLAGGAGAIVYLIISVCFNLAIAHYRNAVAIDPFEASSLAYLSLIRNPLGIEDLQAWTLFIVGFLFSLVACYDGLRMDDSYPGYGTRIRQNLQALEDYSELKEELLEELHDIKKNCRRKNGQSCANH